MTNDDIVKEFDKWMKDVMRINNDELLRHYIPAIHEFLSNRLARADERKQWKEANDLLRSTHSIAERKGKEVNWDGFLQRINEELKREHVIMYPENYVGMHENPAEMEIV